jgi:hypothetical protein
MFMKSDIAKFYWNLLACADFGWNWTIVADMKTYVRLYAYLATDLNMFQTEVTEKNTHFIRNTLFRQSFQIIMQKGAEKAKT